MPWKASSVMEERLRFVARLLDGEAMTRLCREFGISRKTGYKIFDRYKERWAGGAQRPLAPAGALRQPVAAADREPDRQPEGATSRIGAPARCGNCWSGGCPATSAFPPRAPSTPCSTATAWSSRRATGTAPSSAAGTPLSKGSAPNDLWCADFKGEFKLGNGRYCYPLTVTDHASRYLLLCEAARIDPGRHGLSCFPAAVLRARPAARHPLRQRRSLRQSQRPLQSVQALGLVAAGSASPSSASSPAIRSRTAATSACT